MRSDFDLKGALIALKTVDCFVRGRVVGFRFVDEDLRHHRIEDVEHFWLEDVEEFGEADEGVEGATEEDLAGRKGVSVGGGLQQFHAAEILEFWRLDGSKKSNREGEEGKSVLQHRRKDRRRRRCREDSKSVLSSRQRLPFHQSFIDAIDMKKVCLGSRGRGDEDRRKTDRSVISDKEGRTVDPTSPSTIGSESPRGLNAVGPTNRTPSRNGAGVDDVNETRRIVRVVGRGNGKPDVGERDEKEKAEENSFQQTPAVSETKLERRGGALDFSPPSNSRTTSNPSNPTREGRSFASLDRDAMESTGRNRFLDSKVPPAFVVIDSFHDRYRVCDGENLDDVSAFEFAVRDLLGHDVVSVSFKGSCVGRRGALAWISFATEDLIYTFDVLALGREAFRRGIGRVCESLSVVKVVHDCRRSSDLLHHQFGVELKNVFDTQVAEAVFQRQAVRDIPDVWPRYVKSLPVLLKEHLWLDDEKVNLIWVRDRDQAIDERVWLQRPLADDLANIIVKDVAFLQDLHSCLREKLVRDAYRGSEVFLRLHRDAEENRLKILRDQTHLLPKNFPSLLSKGRRRPGFGLMNGQIDDGAVNNAVTSRLTGINFSSSGVTWTRRDSALRSTTNEDDVSAARSKRQLAERIDCERIREYLTKRWRWRVERNLPAFLRGGGDDDENKDGGGRGNVNDDDDDDDGGGSGVSPHPVDREADDDGDRPANHGIGANDDLMSDSAVPDRGQSELAVPEHGQFELAVPDHGQSELAVPDHGQSELALTNHEQSELAVPAHEQLLVVPLPNHVQSELVVPLPDHVQSELAVPLPNHEQSELAVPLPDHGQSELAVPLSDHGQSELAVPLPDHGQSELVVPLPDHGQSELAESCLADLLSIHRSHFPAVSLVDYGLGSEDDDDNDDDSALSDDDDQIHGNVVVRHFFDGAYSRRDAISSDEDAEALQCFFDRVFGDRDEFSLDGRNADLRRSLDGGHPNAVVPSNNAEGPGRIHGAHDAGDSDENVERDRRDGCRRYRKLLGVGSSEDDGYEGALESADNSPRKPYLGTAVKPGRNQPASPSFESDVPEYRSRSATTFKREKTVTFAANDDDSDDQDDEDRASPSPLSRIGNIDTHALPTYPPLMLD